MSHSNASLEPACRYFLRVTIVRRISDIVREIDIAVHTLCSYPDLNCPIKMEVGIEDCLHIEFEYNKSKYVYDWCPPPGHEPIANAFNRCLHCLPFDRIPGTI